LLGIANVLPMSVLQAKAETTKLYKLNIFNSIFKIIAMLIGLYFFGLIGLVVSRIISTYALVGTTYYFVMKE
jgi:O-antigen/teichoic acid export membrane protein